MALSKQKKGLGRGLGALIQDESPARMMVPSGGEKSGVQQVPVERLLKGKMQPRKKFDEEALAELSLSIREHGVLQPLLVRATGEEYELIAGERRLRAATDAGLKTVPVILVDVSDGVAMEIALVENLQRENLNILEEAMGYEVLSDKFNMTQEQIAEKVGKARATVANALRILSLPAEVKGYIVSGELSAGHAKVISGLDIEQERVLYARRAVKENLSVRNLEKMVSKVKRDPKKPRASREDVPRSHLSYLSDKLHTHFGTSIRVTPCRTFANGKKGKGSIEIDYFSNDDLDRLLSLMGIDGE